MRQKNNSKSPNKNELKKMIHLANISFGSGGYSLYFAPSRINIIGEHIDYNGGLVLPCAIEIGTYGVVRPCKDKVIRLKSLNNHHYCEVRLDEDFDNDNGWLNYPLGMMKQLEKAGYAIGGIEGVIYGNIPTGSGLSSSSSLEMLIGEVINQLYNSGNIDRIELAILGQRTENEFIGVASGIMDQFAISMGKKGTAILLNTGSLEYRYVNLELGDHIFVIMNTKRGRRLVDSKYNQRRKECEDALSILKSDYRIDHLCDLKTTDLDKALELLESSELKKRVRHCVTENERVSQAVKAMESGDMQLLGKLLNESHESLKADYEVTGEHLDAIVKAAQDNGATGARMTGAGFGGCAIALVRKQGAEKFMTEVQTAYRKAMGIEGELFLAEGGDGPRKVRDII